MSVSGQLIAAMAIQHGMQKINTVAGNLANLNTHGYLRQQVVIEPFSPFMERTQVSQQLTASGANRLLETQNPFDVAIEGNGFFAVQTPEGLAYTRNGQFMIDDAGVLVAKRTGYPVMGEQGVIRLAQDQPFGVKMDGSLEQAGLFAGKLALVALPEASGLRYKGEGLFDYVGQVAKNGVSAKLRQGYVQPSNVDTATEMMTLVETTRYVEGMQKMLYAYQDLSEKALKVFGDI